MFLKVSIVKEKRKMKQKNLMLKKIFIIFILIQIFSFFSINPTFCQKVSFSSEDSLKSINFLRKKFYEALKEFEQQKTSYGIAVYSLDKNEYYFKHNVDSYFIPASLTKLVTTLSALHKLGKDYKIKTFIYSDGEIKNGVLLGNLYVYGTGDALFSTSDLDFIVGELNKHGIKRVNGNIYSDPSFFDTQTDRFIYSGDFDVVQKTQPITSIAIEKNILKIVVTAGAIYGRSVSVQIFPSSDAIKVYNNAKVGRSLGELKLYPRITYDNFGGGNLISQKKPPHSREQDFRKSFKVSIEKDNDGNQIIVISGHLTSGTTKTYEFFIDNPPLVVAGALKKRLESAGVEVLGNIGIAYVPIDRSRSLVIVERNLVDILKVMNKESDNYLAETVFKIVGAVDKKMTSNSKEAVRYIFSLVDSLKIPCADCKIYDGSGLSRRNRLSPESIIRILIHLKTNPNTQFMDTLLSVAGLDGTLKNRMVNSSAQGKIFAKTGTHSNASGLAGFAKTLDNERIVFVFMYNGEKVFLFKKVEDELCKILAEFFFSNALE